MQIFVIVDFSEKGRDFIVTLIPAEDQETAIDKFCERSVATREDFDDGPLDALEYHVELG